MPSYGTAPRARACARTTPHHGLRSAVILATLLRAGNARAVELSVSTSTAPTGTTAALEVRLADGDSIGGLTFAIGYDGSDVELAEVVPGPALEGVVLATNPERLPSRSGSLRLSGVAQGGFAPSGQLLRLRFVLPDSGAADYPVTLVQASATTLALGEAAVRTQDGGFHAITAVSAAGGALPAATRLLHNYPNPFNAGTYIQYHLAEDASVVLQLYSIDGQRVRRIELGPQAAGYYDSGSGRGAYWDGRDEHGRPAASGVYICVLRAGLRQFSSKVVLLK